MSGDVDNDTLEVCRELLTRAGMLFEDLSRLTICVADLSADRLLDVIQDAIEANGRAAALLAAAAALLAKRL